MIHSVATDNNTPAFKVHLQPGQPDASTKNYGQAINTAGHGVGLQVYPGSVPEVVEAGAISLTQGKRPFVQVKLPKLLSCSQVPVGTPSPLRGTLTVIEQDGATGRPTDDNTKQWVVNLSLDSTCATWRAQLAGSHGLSAYAGCSIARMSLTQPAADSSSNSDGGGGGWQLTLHLAPPAHNINGGGAAAAGEGSHVNTANMAGGQSLLPLKRPADADAASRQLQQEPAGVLLSDGGEVAAAAAAAAAEGSDKRARRKQQHPHHLPPQLYQPSDGAAQSHMASTLAVSTPAALQPASRTAAMTPPAAAAAGRPAATGAAAAAAASDAAAAATSALGVAAAAPPSSGPLQLLLPAPSTLLLSPQLVALQDATSPRQMEQQLVGLMTQGLRGLLPREQYSSLMGRLLQVFEPYRHDQVQVDAEQLRQLQCMYAYVQAAVDGGQVKATLTALRALLAAAGGSSALG